MSYDRRDYQSDVDGDWIEVVTLADLNYSIFALESEIARVLGKTSVRTGSHSTTMLSNLLRTRARRQALFDRRAAAAVAAGVATAPTVEEVMLRRRLCSTRFQEWCDEARHRVPAFDEVLPRSAGRAAASEQTEPTSASAADGVVPT